MSQYLYLIVVLVLIFGMFYFLTYRPVRQREKKHDQMVRELQKGDLVITAGGIYGRIENIDEDSVVLKVESGATLRVTKGAVLAKPEAR
ncbi:MAG: preprotein translocase subunit YajC [Chloroflexi bacterium]|nr:preprotein translocase subunit YajC [Chloroflexota bacterium]